MFLNFLDDRCTQHLNITAKILGKFVVVVFGVILERQYSGCLAEEGQKCFFNFYQIASLMELCGGGGRVCQQSGGFVLQPQGQRSGSQQIHIGFTPPIHGRPNFSNPPSALAVWPPPFST
jgi:hypothetical protein